MCTVHTGARPCSTFQLRRDWIAFPLHQISVANSSFYPDEAFAALNTDELLRKRDDFDVFIWLYKTWCQQTGSKWKTMADKGVLRSV